MASLARVWPAPSTRTIAVSSREPNRRSFGQMAWSSASLPPSDGSTAVAAPACRTSSLRISAEATRPSPAPKALLKTSTTNAVKRHVRVARTQDSGHRLVRYFEDVQQPRQVSTKREQSTSGAVSAANQGASVLPRPSDRCREPAVKDQSQGWRGFVRRRRPMPRS